MHGLDVFPEHGRHRWTLCSYPRRQRWLVRLGWLGVLVGGLFHPMPGYAADAASSLVITLAISIYQRSWEPSILAAAGVPMLFAMIDVSMALIVAAGMLGAAVGSTRQRNRARGLLAEPRSNPGLAR